MQKKGDRHGMTFHTYNEFIVYFFSLQKSEQESTNCLNMLHTFLDESSFVFSCTTLKQSWTLLIKIDITIHFQPFFFLRKSEQENTNCLYIIHTFLDESSFVFSQQSIIIIADSSKFCGALDIISIILYV